jgi:hypothetical protein
MSRREQAIAVGLILLVFVGFGFIAYNQGLLFRTGNTAASKSELALNNPLNSTGTARGGGHSGAIPSPSGSGARRPGTPSPSASGLPTPTPTPTPTGGPTPTPTPQPTPTPTPVVPPPPVAGAMTACGTSFCVNGRQWYMYGASEYQSTKSIGIDYPAATVSLARLGGLNTIRIINFYNKGNPAVTPYDETMWRKVDLMIADAKASNLHIDLGLADYRRILWYNCVNPYTYDWGQLIAFVANRRNTVTGVTYKYDPTIAFISLAGEPLPVGTHTYVSPQTGATCTVTYSGQDLLNFYSRTLGQWSAQGPSVLGNTGGLGYLNEANSGIPWKSIYALPTDAFCDLKTYGGMYAFAPTVAAYCHSIGKPIMDEEFGWQQSAGDSQRAVLLHNTTVMLHANGFAGEAFWNLNYQVGGTSYDISPSTPATWATLRTDSPGV